MATRVALYVSLISWRNVGPGASSAMATCVGLSSPNIERNVLVKPKTAPMSSPVARTTSGPVLIYRARKGRELRLWPSERTRGGGDAAPTGRFHKGAGGGGPREGGGDLAVT